MFWSQTFIPTLKEIPAEAEVASHRLLLRAGIIRKLAGGLYTFLPLGLRVLQKIETIIRQEMRRADAIELLMPALQPPEIWQQSGRYETARDVFFKAQDRAGREWILGPTHEEVITTLMANEVRSYRQLPKTFFQIQTKFRDEIRPRFGLMRAREFVMKDAYSFDVSDESAQKSYQKMFDAYARIFHRCGLRAIPVQADAGVMGGQHSHEFMVPAEIGEDQIVYNSAGTYAANLQKASSAIASAFSDSTDLSDQPFPEKFATPNVKTIEDLTKPPFNVSANRQIKTLIYIAKGEPILVLLKGDDHLNESKLARALGSAHFRAATSDEIFKNLAAPPGSLGAVEISSLKIYADTMLQNGIGLVTGANESGFHFRNVCLDRDIHVDHWAELRSVKSGEACPKTGEPLQLRSAIEVGHVFKLGTKYSEALGARFLDAKGKQHPAIMGCYGIGITRTLQAIIEQHHDDLGIAWPLGVAPFSVCITPLDVKPKSETMHCALSIYKKFREKGIDVILDDRDERPGIKFKDSELIGFPIRITLGARSLKENLVEVKPRIGALQKVSPDAVPNVIATWIEENQQQA